MTLGDKERESLLASRDGIGEPIETLIETSAVGTAATLNVPVVLRNGMNLHLLGNLSDRVSIGKILLVGKNENNSIGHVGLGEERLELQTGLFSAISIVRVNHVD